MAKGYPGWHTECVVMSSKYLGDEFDIHGGGMDLKFPHHECELALARCMGQPFARYWMHSNVLNINGQSMSKSLGNSITLEEACQKYGPLAVRYFIIASHYRSVVDFSEEALQSAQIALLRLYQVVTALRERYPAEASPQHRHFQEYRHRFCAAMDNDFATPQALAVLFDLTRAANNLLKQSFSRSRRHRRCGISLFDLGGRGLGLDSSYPAILQGIGRKI